jgi:hypothetical protein
MRIMQLDKIIRELGCTVKSGTGSLSREVTGGYSSDLLSDVIANASEGNLWITLQTHQNTVAVASMKNLAGIVLVNNREPEEETLKKAQEEGIPLLISDLPAFELIGRLYHLGISGIGK